jgi:hypothetical protein
MNSQVNKKNSTIHDRFLFLLIPNNAITNIQILNYTHFYYYSAFFNKFQKTYPMVKLCSFFFICIEYILLKKKHELK